MSSKIGLKQELSEQLALDLDTLERAQLAVQEAATHDEAKPENDKDTRALEQSYLARGQARRVLELRGAVSRVEAMVLRGFDESQPIALGALVSIEEGDQTQTVFLAPEGGGRRLSKGSVQVVTPESPLGRALLGKFVGDECAVRVGARLRELVIAAVE
jgi:transcription elongation GreA/GreB family factor